MRHNYKYTINTEQNASTRCRRTSYLVMRTIHGTLMAKPLPWLLFLYIIVLPNNFLSNEAML